MGILEFLCSPTVSSYGKKEKKKKTECGKIEKSKLKERDGLMLRSIKLNDRLSILKVSAWDILKAFDTPLHCISTIKQEAVGTHQQKEML